MVVGIVPVILSKSTDVDRTFAFSLLVVLNGFIVMMTMIIIMAAPQRDEKGAYRGFSHFNNNMNNRQQAILNLNYYCLVLVPVLVVVL
jgi:hypothetical protein